MLEILALFFLSKKNGNLAIQKGLSFKTWRIYTIISWIVAEILGIVLAIQIFEVIDTISYALFGLTSGFGGYLLIRFILEKKPNSLQDDIDNIKIENE